MFLISPNVTGLLYSSALLAIQDIFQLGIHFICKSVMTILNVGFSLFSDGISFCQALILQSENMLTGLPMQVC